MSEKDALLPQRGGRDRKLHVPGCRYAESGNMRPADSSQYSHLDWCSVCAGAGPAQPDQQNKDHYAAAVAVGRERG